MKKTEQFFSIELCYQGTIDSKLDYELMELIPQIIADFDKVNCEWYFSEATVKEPNHRLMGWALSRNLSYYELVTLHNVLTNVFEGRVFIIRT